jgi:hypothetical protein
MKRTRKSVDMSEDLSEPARRFDLPSRWLLWLLLFVVRRMVSQPHIPLPVIGTNVVDEHIRDEDREYDGEQEIDNVYA